MTEPRPHGATRPGGRTARTRTAVLNAAWEELETRDFASLTIDRLAQHSGVHAATIRRRWRTVEGVLCDLVSQYSASSIPLPDTGTLHEDLHALAHAIADFYSAPRNRHLVEGFVITALREPGAEQVLREAFSARIRLVSVLLERAVRRGEIPADTDAEEVIAALGAPFYYRILITRRPIDDDLARTSAEAAYLAAVHGVFRTGGAGGAGGKSGPDSAGEAAGRDGGGASGRD
ncbi:TetR family transcriptional regulator [Streptomyces albus subsp. chlorinus]|uniref:TetR-like C-terminal domain-containing protein n=1 Tax=Streptomyces albus TaxID=1888 RepID=UPI0015700C2B|nr:TetR-like C-terminal domain-containing protein [Streptomyces albus]NSC22372.1 TetR family transcriptional regulator [Streptomyces albus subsp. chlorinus]